MVLASRVWMLIVELWLYSGISGKGGEEGFLDMLVIVTHLIGFRRVRVCCWVNGLVYCSLR